MAKLGRNGEIKYSFVEVMRVIAPYYLARFIGGLLFFIGTAIMAYNLFMTSFEGKKP